MKLMDKPLDWATRPTCNRTTYGTWLQAHRFLDVFHLEALGVIADKGGSWTVGDDCLLYPGARGLNPRTHLTQLVRYGYAIKTGEDTWAITDRGTELDRGRPHSDLNKVIR